MTDELDADSLIRAREGASFDPRADITAAYEKTTYYHFGNSDEKPMPICKVLDQGPVEVNDGVNAGAKVTHRHSVSPVEF